MARPVTKNTFKNKTKNSMKNLGTYKKEFDDLIDIYSGMLYSYYLAEVEWEEHGYRVTEEVENTKGVLSDRKLPIVVAMESLRKDILTYSDRLFLNPKSIEAEVKNKGAPEATGLEGMLGKLMPP